MDDQRIGLVHGVKAVEVHEHDLHGETARRQPKRRRHAPARARDAEKRKRQHRAKNEHADPVEHDPDHAFSPRSI